MDNRMTRARRVRHLAFAIRIGVDIGIGVAIGIGVGTQAAAQAPSARFDTATVRTYTVAALLGAARSELTTIRGNPTTAAVVVMAERLLQRVDRPAVTRLPLDIVVQAQLRTGDSRRAGLARLARWNRRSEVAGIGAGDAADLDSLTRLMAAELRFAMEARQPAVSDDSVDIILAPLTALNFARLNVSIEQSLEKLNRFERKYGPGAPQLNIAEVGLNYLAQWVPLFQPNGEGWPSRWEVVASYVPTYLTIADEQVRPVTVGEVGLRGYLWRRGWGGAAGGLLRPGYLSFGVAVAGARDGAFVSPLQGKARIGAFLGWGQAKIAVLGGSERRVIVTRQFQVVPWVF